VKYLKVFFQSFLARILLYCYLKAFFIARASYPAAIFNFYKFERYESRLITALKEAFSYKHIFIHSTPSFL